MSVFRLPDLGEGLTEADIVTWHVEVGDTVAVDQPVVEVETAKAVVEVPVPFAGVVLELHGEPGERLSVGSPLITVDAADDALERGRAEDETAAGLAEPPDLARKPGASSRAPDEVTTGNVLVGSGVAAEPMRRRRARQQRGLATRADVQKAISVQGVPSSLVAVQRPAEGLQAETTARIPMRGTRKAMAEKVARSRREIPEATIWVDVDATALLELREELAAGTPNISILALIARFALAGLARYPELNALIENDEILMSSDVHMGFAAMSDRGLVVPVVRNAHTLTLDALAQALTQLMQQARAGKLMPSQLIGGTFTITNYGVFGIDGSAAIINHPEVAILGIGRIMARPWVVEGQVAARRVMQLTLAFDHRACDGSAAADFLRFVGDCIEHPSTLLH
jgi:2-oxoisovalerate dehydrogenase E2 component (dihydrolipoyl transacylase)